MKKLHVECDQPMSDNELRAIEIIFGEGLELRSKGGWKSGIKDVNNGE